jgi:hypothetical protein
MAHSPKVLVLTPLKDAAKFLDGYFDRLARLTHPADRLSLGLLEGDSSDSTFADVERLLPALRQRYRRVGLWRKDFGLRIAPGQHRWAIALQVPRRVVLAKCRNRLLFHALDDEEWVLWLDVDVIEYPADIIERLLGYGKDILQPHCVVQYGGETYDQNAWVDQGRLFMQDLRGKGDLVRLDSVGGTMLFIRADLHRDGLVFPPYPYGAESPGIRKRNPYLRGKRGEMETEGLAFMARDMGAQCWGLPNLEILHYDEAAHEPEKFGLPPSWRRRST